MKNNILKIFQYLFFLIICFNANSVEQFNFNIKEIEILEEGNKYLGKKKGTITTDTGVIINANQFIYDKKSNILDAKGDVKINDTINEYVIFSEEITYDKNKEIIFTKEFKRN